MRELVELKKLEISTLTNQNENLKMKLGETIKEMQLRYTHIINHLVALGQTYTTSSQIYKILRALTAE